MNVTGSLAPLCHKPPILSQNIRIAKVTLPLPFLHKPFTGAIQSLSAGK